MRGKMPSVWIIMLTTVASVRAMSQGQLQTLVVTGHEGSVPVTEINGRHYVEVEALARLANGALSFNGNQVTLTLSTTGENAAGAAAPAGTPSPGANTGFSREFLRAAIEAMSTIREWHSALASAIKNQFPFTQDELAPYQSQAMKNLRLAQAAATMEADQNATRLMTSEYQRMKQLSDKYTSQRANMRYIPPDALKNDSLDQRLIACGKSLVAMAASGQFVDDGTCD